MSAYCAVVLSALAGAAWCDLTFPPGFKFGAATSSYQVEGAWNVSDKAESIWDRFAHTHPESIADGSNGDVACDSYHQYKRDVQLAADMGLEFYRFSISWPRLLPNGFSNRISKNGQRYYNDLINELLKNGIEPVVTLYHWDLPQKLQDLGGWTNPLISDWFEDYARVVFSLYADRVKTWITVNEPMLSCDASYNTGAMAPGIYSPHFGSYLCTKHVLIAHAKAWRIYDREYRPKYRGQISLANHLLWYEPVSPEHAEVLELAMEYNIGRFSHPIYSAEGGWPPSLEKYIADKSKKQGYSRSRLPPFTKEERTLVKGTYDYYGLNHYTSRLIRKARPGEVVGPFPTHGIPDIEVAYEIRPDWAPTFASWLKVNPVGIRNVMRWIKQRYGNVAILISENGFPDSGDNLDDTDRMRYYKHHLEQVLLSINEDGVNVTGYAVWSLLDNFEWMDGYNTKFGLHAVDFTDPLRPRTPRQSAHYYARVIRTRSLDAPAKYISDELYVFLFIFNCVYLFVCVCCAVLFLYFYLYEEKRLGILSDAVAKYN